ncbi:helix-turn-helix domain-containing protein [Desulfotomaculum nigrificans]|uniref:helix-turn-helix domain-containing protein n=1 Tax=Desulfotomaculum nigrificans TaxID=1565 RepID=UPI0001FAEB12|nr:helix-turn-helix transcriptional regulator [Desulfotomaculum nigrificans]
MDIASRIIELRKNIGFNTNQLAKLANISYSTLYEVETGKKQPSVYTLEKICTALGITLSEFFSDTQEQEPLPPEVRQICEKVKQLPPDKLKVLNAVLDTWKGE